MNNELKNRILGLKDQLKRGDMARIVERVSVFGIQKYDVYNILNGKSLVDTQKLILVMKEVKRCIDENQRYLEEFEMKISESDAG
jgi:hypothetical protein